MVLIVTRSSSSHQNKKSPKRGFFIYTETTLHRLCHAWSSSSLWFLDLEIYTSIVLNANNAEQRSDRFCCCPLTTHNLSHILRIDTKREEYSHFINLSFDF